MRILLQDSAMLHQLPATNRHSINLQTLQPLNASDKLFSVRCFTNRHIGYFNSWW